MLEFKHGLTDAISINVLAMVRCSLNGSIETSVIEMKRSLDLFQKTFHKTCQKIGHFIILIVEKQLP